MSNIKLKVCGVTEEAQNDFTDMIYHAVDGVLPLEADAGTVEVAVNTAKAIVSELEQQYVVIHAITHTLAVTPDSPVSGLLDTELARLLID